MIYLVTGTPGSGKTLYVVRELMRKIGNQRLPDGSPRPVVHNIPNLRLYLLDRDRRTRRMTFAEKRAELRARRERWAHVQPAAGELGQTWQSYDDGTVFILDEVQRVWPARYSTANAPEYITLLDYHRHHGFDFWIISQDPSLISPMVRRFVGRHFDVVRPNGAKQSRISSWEACNSSPPRPTGSEIAEVERVRFDSTLFRLYSSATIHAQTFRWPRKLLAACLFVLVIVLGSTYYVTGAVGFLRSGEATATIENGPDGAVRTFCAPIATRQPLTVRVRGELLRIDRDKEGVDLLSKIGSVCMTLNRKAPT